MAELSLDDSSSKNKDADTEKPGLHVRDLNYAIILINEHYDRLNETLLKLGENEHQDIPYVKDDLMNMKSLVSMMDIPEYNIFKLIDESYEKVN